MQQSQKGVPLFVRQIFLILWKDFLAERRTKESFPQMLMFALLILVIFNVTIQIGTPLQDFLPGLLWIAFTFAGILGLNHSFSLEHDNACLEGMRLCPVDRSAIYLGKVLGNFLFMVLTELILFPVIVILFNLTPGRHFITLAGVVLLGTLGFTAIGTLFAAMSANTKIREVLLPLLVFPIVIPILIAAVKATTKILAQQPWAEISFGIQFLIVFDLIFLGLATLTFEHILESE
ncbi:hypothetical protein GF339_17400 [candidate division KSB3 bacterium]|uniref:Heme exporter protein B n=1 Tax=candidate division KSB3 bacterium TaxID=2044937 RepID=A0A9D5JYB8_9BACT|nr:hypothetical protein [candidate division KSB3 bacterium]MBD3326365.1 hypothetical protein [candidate division KSB3 bacterium]